MPVTAVAEATMTKTTVAKPAMPKFTAEMGMKWLSAVMPAVTPAAIEREIAIERRWAETRRVGVISGLAIPVGYRRFGCRGRARR